MNIVLFRENPRLVVITNNSPRQIWVLSFRNLSEANLQRLSNFGILSNSHMFFSTVLTTWTIYFLSTPCPLPIHTFPIHFELQLYLEIP